MTNATGELEGDNAYQVTTLDHCGLRVVTERISGVHSAAISAWIGTGSRHEAESAHGYAHFLEHLLFKGSERIDAEGISRYFDGIGSDLDAATTREYTVLSTRVLERHVDRSLEIMGEMLLDAALEPDDVDAEREVILEEIAMYDDSPSDVVHEIADANVFPNHSLGRSIAGTTSSIKAAPISDLVNFYHDNYRTDNIVISAAGSIDHAEFVNSVQSHLLANRKTRVQASSTSVLAPLTAYKPTLDIREKESEQVHLVLSGRGIARTDKRRYAAAILDAIFGNGPSSRLFLEIRERRGLAYSVYSFLSNYADAGSAGLYVGVRPDRLEELLDILHKELTSLTKDAPTLSELELAKGQLEGRMLLSLESTSVRGNRLGVSLLSGMPIESVKEVSNHLDSVTQEDIYELANELFDPTKLSLIAVADDAKIVENAVSSSGFAFLHDYSLDTAS